MLYVAYRILCEDPGVKIACGNSRLNDRQVFLINEGKAELVSVANVVSPCYYLFDCGQAESAPSTASMDIAGIAKKSVVFTSPDAKDYRQYEKSILDSNETESSIVVCMPPWSWEEIEFCQKHIYIPM